MTTQNCIAQALRDPLVMSLSSRTSKQLTAAVMAAYAKHWLGKDDIGWDELGTQLHDAICEAIGDDVYQRWIADMKEVR